MKAKDLLLWYHQQTGDESERVLLVANSLFNEIKDIMKIRRVQSNAGLASIIKEQNDKWRAFLRLLPAEQREKYNESAVYAISTIVVPNTPMLLYQCGIITQEERRRLAEDVLTAMMIMGELKKQDGEPTDEMTQQPIETSDARD